jgi:LCP family protein required for cell wall assembly
MDQGFRIPKKRRPSDSIDGIVPRGNSKITTHRYYSAPSTRSAGPRKPVLSQTTNRKPRVHEEISLEDIDDTDTPKIGDFSGSDDPFIKRKPQSRRARKSMKEKKKPGKIRSWWKNRSLKFKFAFILLLVVLGAGGLLGVRLYSFLNSVFAKNVGNSSSAALGDKIKPEQLNTEGDGRFNILMLGRGGAENEAPDLTDTLLVASVDLENQSVALLSIPRDMYVKVDGSGMKINAAYSTGKSNALSDGKSKDAAETDGIKTAISAVREVAGVPIHKYVLTDYKAFRDVVNALGGVDVNVKEPIFDNFTGWRFKAGPQTMDGDTALKYVRTRQGSARGDFDRNENQRNLLIAMRKKATSTGIVANPVRLNSLANAIQKNIRTDMSIDEAKTIFEKTKTMEDNKIKSLDLAKPDDPLVTTGNLGGQSIVRPAAGLYDYSKIRAYARTNMMDPYLKKEAPTVAIYNGSGKAGVATTVGDILAGYGYKVLTKETSKEDQTKTIIVKKTTTPKPFTDRFLTVRFSKPLAYTVPNNVIPSTTPATTTTTSSSTSSATSSSTAPEPDYIIVLGADYRQKFGPTW